MDQVPLNRIVQLGPIHHLPLEQPAITPPHAATPLLIHQQPTPQLLRFDLEEAGQLVEVHCRVELEVGLDGRVEEGVFHLVHEDGGLVVDGVDVEGGVVEVGRGGRDEFRTGGAEELFEQRQRVGPAALEARELLAVFLAQRGVDCVVEARGVEGGADGDEGVHLLVLLRDGVVLVVLALLEVLGPADVDEDVAEHANRVGVAA